MDPRKPAEIAQQKRLEATLATAKAGILAGAADAKSVRSRAESQYLRYPNPAMLEDPSQFKHVTVYGRKNQRVEPFTEFKVDGYKKVFNADRMQGVTAYDAIRDPHLTMAAPVKPKDQGYFELNKRSSIHHDLKSKVIQDYNGTSIIKIDSLHGAKNGLLWGQSTHVNLNGTDRPNARQTFGKDCPNATINAMKRFTRAGE